MYKSTGTVQFSRSSLRGGVGSRWGGARQIVRAGKVAVAERTERLEVSSSEASKISECLAADSNGVVWNAKIGKPA